MARVAANAFLMSYCRNMRFQPHHFYLDFILLGALLSGERGKMIDFLYAITFGPMELMWQSQRVVSLRLNKFALQDAGSSLEADLMVNEKLSAFSDAAMKLAMGTFPHVVMQGLRSIVDENVVRLSA